MNRRNPAKSAAWFELGGMLPVAASTQVWALRFKTGDHRKRLDVGEIQNICAVTRSSNRLLGTNV